MHLLKFEITPEVYVMVIADCLDKKIIVNNIMRVYGGIQHLDYFQNINYQETLNILFNANVIEIKLLSKPYEEFITEPEVNWGDTVLIGYSDFIYEEIKDTDRIQELINYTVEYWLDMLGRLNLVREIIESKYSTEFKIRRLLQNVLSVRLIREQDHWVL